MTISAKVPKDVSAIKKKLVFNLTKRQIISFLLAGAAGFSAYSFLKNYMETDMAALVMTGVMMPFLFVGIYEKDGYSAEQKRKTGKETKKENEGRKTADWKEAETKTRISRILHRKVFRFLPCIRTESVM